MTPLLVLAAASIAPPQVSAGELCQDFAERYGQPIPVRVTPLAADALGSTGAAQASLSHPVSVGQFTYRGHGIEIRSEDPRFLGVLDPAIQELGGSCAYQFEGPSGWNARDTFRQTPTLRFRKVNEPLRGSRGATEARSRGALPILAGHELVSSWPVAVERHSYFLGLMRPLHAHEESVVVAFSDVARATPALVLARLPMRLDELTALRDLHLPTIHLNLEGVGKEPIFRRLVLEMSIDQARAIADRLSIGQTK